MTSSSTPRVLHIGDEAPTPSFFLRFREPAESLGMSYSVCRAENLWNQRVNQYGDAHFCMLPLIQKSELIYLQRAFSVYSLDLFKALKQYGKPIIYETDDLLSELPPWSGLKLSPAQRNAIREMVRGADLVTCSTAALAERLSELNTRVRAIENYGINVENEQVGDAPHLAIVNTDYFKLIEQKTQLFSAIEQAISTLGIRVTFLGSIDPAMEDLARRYPERVALYREFVPWHRRFLQSIASAGVNMALVPLECSPHHRYKSDVKFFDFASIGAPAVFNNPEVYKRVTHKVNGYLCDGTREGWLDGLTFLADKDNRLQCSGRAREAVQGRTLHHYADEFQQALNAVKR